MLRQKTPSWTDEEWIAIMKPLYDQRLTQRQVTARLAHLGVTRAMVQKRWFLVTGDVETFAKIVTRMRDGGDNRSNPEIALELGCSVAAINYATNKWMEARRYSLRDIARCSLDAGGCGLEITADNPVHDDGRCWLCHQQERGNVVLYKALEER